jgi:aminopeptidase N
MCSPPSAPSPSTERGSASASHERFVSLTVFDCPPSGRTVGVLVLVVGVAATAIVAAQRPTPAAGTPIDVSHYAVALDLDVDRGSISGTERIELTMRAPGTALVFDSGALVVDSVSTDSAGGSRTVPFAQDAQQLIVALPAPAREGDQKRLDIAYHGRPRNGLTLSADRQQAYTTFSTSQWMVAVDAPAERAALDLDVSMPAGWHAAGSGREVEHRTRDGRMTYRWRHERETSSFLYGFIAGRFTEATAARGNVSLRYLGSPFSTEQLQRIFGDTPRMLAFFEERAGVPYPGDSYTQALVTTSGGQELSGLAHVSEAYGRAVLDDATATGLIAHELAHQWWGDLVTNRDWTHFWLNEGVATFMASAYKERTRGHEAYLADVAAWRRRVEELRAAGHDKPLVFPDWNRPSADDRAVVYQKGALALHTLREQMGDTAFWTALRDYTKGQAGQTVRSADLQRSFEASSGRDLGAFFDEWVNRR